MPSEVTRDEIEAFRRDGFVVIPGLLDPDELDELGAEVDAGVALRSRGDTRNLADKSAYEQSFIQCMRLWETDAAVAPLTFHPALEPAAGARATEPAGRHVAGGTQADRLGAGGRGRLRVLRLQRRR